MQKHASKKNINGLLLLDKPIGISSNAALQQVKRIFSAAKAGHTGSLDPLASGMLPICFGRATKFSEFLLTTDKTYLVTMQLGQTTTTGDAEGEILTNVDVPEFSSAQIQSVLQSFIGEQQQIPPMYSAVKHNGQPLYKLARKGIEVTRKPRLISIYNIELSQQEDQQLTLSIHCSKGTYVRTLIEDIGQKLGCGAYVRELRRTQVGHLLAKDMYNLDQLATLATQGDAALHQILCPIEDMLLDWPALQLSNAAIFYLRQGRDIKAQGLSGPVRVLRQDGRFIGMANVLQNGVVKAIKMLPNITDK